MAQHTLASACYCSLVMGSPRQSGLRRWALACGLSKQGRQALHRSVAAGPARYETEGGGAASTGGFTNEGLPPSFDYFSAGLRGGGEEVRWRSAPSSAPACQACVRSRAVLCRVRAWRSVVLTDSFFSLILFYSFFQGLEEVAGPALDSEEAEGETGRRALVCGATALDAGSHAFECMCLGATQAAHPIPTAPPLNPDRSLPTAQPPTAAAARGRPRGPAARERRRARGPQCRGVTARGRGPGRRAGWPGPRRAGGRARSQRRGGPGGAVALTK